MEPVRLNALLRTVAIGPENIYPPSVKGTVMGNFLEAMEDLRVDYRIRKNARGKRYVRLLRDDRSVLGDIEPARLPSCPQASKAICNDKVRTSEALLAGGVGVPDSATYLEHQRDIALREAFRERDEVVVKAHSMTLGQGVFVGVRKHEFTDVFQECVKLQRDAGRDPRVLVQEVLRGFEMRATVVEGVLDNLLVKIPGYVTGDGSATVDQLIDAKNGRRAECGFFGNKLLRRDHHTIAHLRSQSLTLNSIPASGQNIPLTAMATVSFGSETALVTHLVSDRVREQARRAVAAIPGLMTAGVDIVVDEFESEQPKVLEVNSFPHMTCIHPSYGSGSNTARRYLKALTARDRTARGKWNTLDDVDRSHVAGALSFYDLKQQLAPR